MRWCLLVAAFLAVVFGCGQGLNRGAGGGGGSVCDGKDTCDECRSCAEQNPCRDEIERCQNNSGCNGLDQCIAVCMGAVQCENDCRANNAGSVPMYDQTLDCVFCTQCPTDCAGFRTCE